MWHFEYWSLASLFNYFRSGGRYNAVMTAQERADYSLLDVKSKVVLDVGATMGDSAELFLNNGAKRVVCIECQKELADKIKDSRCLVISEYFELSHLKIPHDVMKMDIEGFEAMLLPYLDTGGELKPSIIEVHNEYLIREFAKRGFVKMREPELPECALRICLMRNF